jgi:hypothetical protein
LARNRTLLSPSTETKQLPPLSPWINFRVSPTCCRGKLYVLFLYHYA